VSLATARARDADDRLAQARDRFSVPDGLIYLDGNSLGAMPRGAPARIARTVEREWGDDLITSWNRHGWIDLPQRCAAKLGPIVDADPDDLLIGDSTSVNLFKLLVAALGLTGRRVILTEEGNFPTDLYVASGITRLFPDVELRRVPRDRIVESLGSDIAILMLTHVDYRSGWRHHMPALSSAAWDCGALSLWDVSHTAGAMSMSLSGSGADMAVGCGYKYLNGGPGAPSFCYIRREWQEKMRSPIEGWMGHANPFDFAPDYSPAAGMKRFLAGTPSILALAALEAGLDTFEGLNLDHLEDKADALGDFMIEAMAQLCPDLPLASPRRAVDRGSHLVFEHPDAYAIIQALIARGVIGDYREPGLMRFGLAPLTTRYQDVWNAASAIADVLASGEYTSSHFARRSAVT
jgi:kynureninase